MKFDIALNSYLFFALFIFSSLALLSSEFSDTFSQLFMLLCRDGRAYNIFSIIILMLSVCVLLVNLIRVHKKRGLFSKTTFFISTMIGVCVIALCSFIIIEILQSYNTDSSTMISVGIDNGMVLMRDTRGYIFSMDFFLFLFSFILLIFLPLIYRIVSLNLNIESRIAKSLLILKPNVSTVLMAIFAISFQPFLFVNTANYFEFIIFIFSFILLCIVLICKKSEFGFYENMNLFILCIGILVFSLCSNSIFYTDFYNARIGFYSVSILSWCSGWSFNIYKLEDKLLG